MAVIYGSMRKAMEKEHSNMAVICREEQKSEEMIEQMHDMLLHILNCDRAYHTHTQPYECYDSANKRKNGREGDKRTQSKKWLKNEGDDIIDEGRSPLLEKFQEQLSVTQVEICEWSRMSWIEDLDTDEVILWVKSQSEKNIELLTLVIVDGFRQTEIAEMWGVSDTAISKRMKRIRTSLEQVLPERLKKKYMG